MCPSRSHSVYSMLHGYRKYPLNYKLFSSISSEYAISRNKVWLIIKHLITGDSGNRESVFRQVYKKLQDSGSYFLHSFCSCAEFPGPKNVQNSENPDSTETGNGVINILSPDVAPSGWIVVTVKRWAKWGREATTTETEEGWVSVKNGWTLG